MLINDILDFLFPRYCTICDKRLTTQEQHLCLPCYMHLPRTLNHKVEHSDLEKLFWGLRPEGDTVSSANTYRLPIEKGISFFFYTESTKNILMLLKYNSYPQIGTYLASQFVEELKADSSPFFDDIDLIVPIPLHWMRRIKRGYNQSEYIALGIKEKTGIPICTKAIKRIVNNKSQTHMQKHQRHENVKDIFRLTHPELLQDKHILIVDDVTTTGSTIASCCQELLKVPNVKLSILTLAFANQSTTPANDEKRFSYIPITTDRLEKL